MWGSLTRSFTGRRGAAAQGPGWTAEHLQETVGVTAPGSTCWVCSWWETVAREGSGVTGMIHRSAQALNLS